MESPSTSKDIESTNISSPVKSNGLDCNGIDAHQSDCDVSMETESLPTTAAGATEKAATKVANGFSNPCKDKSGEPVGKSAACGTNSVLDVPTVEESSSNSTLKQGLGQTKDTKACEQESDTPNLCKMSSEVEGSIKDNKKPDDRSSGEGEEDMVTNTNKKESGLAQEKESKSHTHNVGTDNIKELENLPGNSEPVVGKLEGPDKLSPKDLKRALKESLNRPKKEETKNCDRATKSQKPIEVAKVTQSKLERLESSDDIEIIGESFTQKPSNQSAIFMGTNMQAMNSVPFQTGFAANNGNIPAIANMQSAMTLQNMRMPGMKTGLMSPIVPSGHGQYMFPGAYPSQGVSLLNHPGAHAPPTPKSSMDQIELIRWEIQNRINVRPKYFKPNPSSELGPLAKFLFDIGSDLIKESVYHDLVKIQSKKNDDDKLSEKERDDLAKLKEIEKDLQATIGHLKLRFKKRCQDCGFQTESNNVLFFHKQFPHENNKNLRCAHCSFSTKQNMAFKFHMEAEHAIQGRLHEKKAFFECHMCPYENNQEQKLVLHRERCLKQFRPLFNLHPSCLSGAEINLCLENIFYKPLVPKNLKLLQQKHAQQQAALAEAKRQQAQMQMIAAQKSAAALAAKKQQQLQQQHLQQQQQHLQQQQLQLQKQRQLTNISPRFNSNVNHRTQSLLPRQNVSQQPSVRYNGKSSRQTVANMLNNKGNNGAHPVQNSPPGGFEVCEICGGYVKDRKALRIHFFYAHRIDLPFNLFERNQAPLYCATCYVRFWTAQGLRKHIDTHKEENQTRGVVGKCISCGHHVLNLLLHMRIVHNRELQHYINALMCMFCGGHFSSRQDCERHIIKTHGNVDPVSGTLKSPPLASQVTSSQGTPPVNVKSTSSAKKSSGRGGAANSLVKGSVCVLCNLNFGRNVDLTRHCMRMHHTCMKCGMVVIDKASLLKHTCLTSPSGTRDCGMCGESGFHPAYYVKHLRDKHLRKFSIKVAKVSKDVVERWTRRPFPCAEDVLVEISDSDDESPSTSSTSSETRRRSDAVSRSPLKKPKIGPAFSKVKKPVKKPKIGPASKIGRCPLTDKAQSKTGDDIQEKDEEEKETAHMTNGDIKSDADTNPEKYKSNGDNAAGECGSNKLVESEKESGSVESNAEEESCKGKDSSSYSTLSNKSADGDTDTCNLLHAKPEKRKSLDSNTSESSPKKRKLSTDINADV
ncbi:MOG interacting and ectopic P-granules protein 1 [Elysia marginata]|uniref:MOG interacting and ectopic P-granules protein 1 n=1 Tax=Elysia marginata TaxID=1093978 RepID=A0AAV4GAV1_9GAST|nr:MOG interacting and ectopic P-granules protein 1 [Elysia marginata]